MTKSSSHPFVLVSQFSREAAKAIDKSRQEWLLVKDNDIEYGSIPIGERYKDIEIRMLNHESLLMNFENIEKNIAHFEKEVVLLQEYLGNMGYGIAYTNKFLLWGKQVHVDVFSAHRKAIIAMLEYKKILANRLKRSLITHNNFLARDSKRFVNKLATHNSSRLSEIVNELSYALRFCAAVFRFQIPEQFQSLLDESNNIIDEIVERYIADNGIDKVNQGVWKMLDNKVPASKISKLLGLLINLNTDQVNEIIEMAKSMQGNAEDYK